MYVLVSMFISSLLNYGSDFKNGVGGGGEYQIIRHVGPGGLSYVTSV